MFQKQSKVLADPKDRELAKTLGHDYWRTPETATETLPTRGPSGPAPVFPQVGAIGSQPENVQAAWAPCRSGGFAYKVTSQVLPADKTPIDAKGVMKVWVVHVSREEIPGEIRDAGVRAYGGRRAGKRAVERIITPLARIPWSPIVILPLQDSVRTEQKHKQKAR